MDSTKQISAAEYQEMKKKQDRQNSRSDHLETFKDGEERSRPTVRILLNKWQRQKEKEQMRQERDYLKYQEVHKKGGFKKKMNITGIVVSFNIARMKA